MLEFCPHIIFASLEDFWKADFGHLIRMKMHFILTSDPVKLPSPKYSFTKGTASEPKG